MLGTLAMSIASALKLALQLAVIPVLARLLGPSAFGLVALAMPLILFANTFCDAGLGNALVRNPDSSKELESTVFWLSSLTGFALALVLAGLAFPISALMSAPKLAPILIVLSFILPISGSLSVVNARISREQRFGLFALVETVAGISASTIAILAALSGAGPWSLVIQQGVLWTVKVIWLLPASGFRPMRFCRPSLAWPYLHFGLHSVAANVADFLSKNLAVLIVGWLISVSAAGHYAMAYQIVRVPELIISGPLYLTIFVAVARWGDNHSGAVPLALRGLRGLVTLLAPLFCGMAVVSGLAVHLVLGSAWTATGPILALLAPAGFFLCSFSFIGAIMLGLGRSDQQFRLIALSGSLLVVGTLVGAHFGAMGVAAGMSIGASLALPAYVRALSTQLQASAATIARVTLPPILASAFMGLLVFAVRSHMGSLNPFLQLASLVALGACAYVLALAALSGEQLRQDVRWVFGSKTAEHDLPA